MTKMCHRCKIEKNLEEFSKNASRPDGVQSSCKVCMTAYKSAHYQNNKDKVKAGNKGRKQAVREKLWEYKQGKICIDCGVSDPRLFDFDHLRDKSFNISRMVADGYSWSSILTEIAKCEIVCSNCHRVRTWERAGWSYGPLE